MKRMRIPDQPSVTSDTTIAEAASAPRRGLFGRMGAEIKSIWEVSSHGHTHGNGPGQHSH